MGKPRLLFAHHVDHLNADQARTKARQGLHHLATALCLTDNELAACINAVILENALGKIEPDCRNLVHGAVPFDVCHNGHPGTPMPSAGRSTPSN